jgi:hypothetical protein
MTIETIPLTPYRSHKELKIALGVIFCLYLLSIIASLFSGVCSKNESASPAPPTEGADKESVAPALAKASYFSRIKQPLSKAIDVSTLVLGCTLCVVWAVLIVDMRELEIKLMHLHRPEEDVVAYDDTDADTWSNYHHDIDHIQEMVEDVVGNMVG